MVKSLHVLLLYDVVYFDKQLLFDNVCSKSLRGIVEEQIAYYLVLPNRLPIQLSSALDPTAVAMLKYPLPQVFV